jgi:hypothetical protein
MTTVIDLTPEEIEELKAITGESEIAAAVRKAMTGYLRYARRQKVKGLSGHIERQDNWEQLESLEPRPVHESPGLGPLGK